MTTTLEPMAEGWQRLLAVVAHPDDLEYGAASAVARWTHAVDVTSSLDAGIESLEAHRAHLDGLGREFDPGEFLRAMTIGPGRALGVEHGVAFDRVQLAGV